VARGSKRAPVGPGAAQAPHTDDRDDRDDRIVGEADDRDDRIVGEIDAPTQGPQSPVPDLQLPPMPTRSEPPSGSAPDGSGATAPDGRATESPTVPVQRRSGSSPGPFTPVHLERLDDALAIAEDETGLDFSVYVGELAGDSRESAEELHASLGQVRAANHVLIAVDPGRRVLEIVTGEQSSRRLSDRACALAALSMTASFGLGDLVGGLVTGLRMLSDQAGRQD